MTFSLKNHPFDVEAFFESSLVLAFAIPKNELQSLIPECLELDTLHDKYAFLAVAFVQTRNLRPKGFPAFIGNDFFLLGYRVFVKYVDSRGKRLRGLYILKSETNKKKMSLLGNIFTHYNYTTTDIHYSTSQEKIKIYSKKSDLDIKVNINKENIFLPSKSVFKNWKEARRYSGPLPFPFPYNKLTKEVLIIEGVRENWTPKPVEIEKAHVGFIQDKKFTNCQLANAFIVENIPYHWKKGRTEIWKN